MEWVMDRLDYRQVQAGKSKESLGVWTATDEWNLWEVFVYN
jgi:hypothetical protein